MELDQAQVMNDLRERSAPIKKFPPPQQTVFHETSDILMPQPHFIAASRMEAPLVSAPIVAPPVIETPQPPPLTNEPTFSKPSNPPPPAFGNSGPSGHALLDKIISNVQSEMAPEANKLKPPIYGEIEESL